MRDSGPGQNTTRTSKKINVVLEYGSKPTITKPKATTTKMYQYYNGSSNPIDKVKTTTTTIETKPQTLVVH